jgi:alpha-N-arabinofuranosidase
VTHDASSSRAAVFLVNRDMDASHQARVDLRALHASRLVEARTLSDPDLRARNTHAQPERIKPAANASVRLDGGQLSIELPPVSWTAIAVATTDQ